MQCRGLPGGKECDRWPSRHFLPGGLQGLPDDGGAEPGLIFQMPVLYDVFTLLRVARRLQNATPERPRAAC
jgi:hypothetical protein